MGVFMNNNTLKSVYIESVFACEKDDYFGENVTLLGTATGFYYKYKNRMFLVTNKHVVTGKNTFNGQYISTMGAIPTALRTVVNFDIINNDNSHEYFEVTLVYELYDDLQCQLDKLWYENDHSSMIDVAVIDVTERYYKSIEKIKEVRQCKDCDWYYYNYSDGAGAHYVTEDIFVVGFPFGYKSTGYDGWYAIWNNGTIASEYEKALVVPVDSLLNESEYIVADAFLVDAKTWEGQSGSPVLASVTEDNAKLLGIYSGRTNKDSSLGYVWKIDIINQIVQRVCG